MVTQTENFSDAGGIEDKTVTTTVDLGNRKAEITVQTVPEPQTDRDDRVSVAGHFDGIPFQATLIRVVDTSDSENKYAVDFTGGVGASMSFGDVVASSVSKVYIAEEDGDAIFTACGKKTAGERESEMRKNSMVHAVRAFAENDEEFRQDMLQTLQDAE